MGGRSLAALRFASETPKIGHLPFSIPGHFFILTYGADFVLLYTKLYQQCVALNFFFVPRSQPAGNMQSFVDFGTRTVLKDYFFDHPLDIFLTFLFLSPA